jgi:lipoic acid synthetase
MNRLPSWFKQEIPDSTVLNKLNLLSQNSIQTVCQEAKCPNLATCFKNSSLTFLLLGNICTRDCRFCAVKKTDNTKLSLDLDEPFRVADIIKKLGLNFVALTSVTRDDLEDGGAEIFAKTINLIRRQDKNIGIEALIPDFKGSDSSLEIVLKTTPEVIGHNIETVRRLYKDLRPKASYEISLEVLRMIKALSPGIITKSSIMLGLGEKEEEVIETLKDLRYTLCDILILGQYLAPSTSHYPVQEFLSPSAFTRYRDIGYSLGFKVVSCGPLVRSSYRAMSVYQEALYA